MAHTTPGITKLPPPLVGEGWGGGAAPAPALPPGPFTPGIYLPYALGPSDGKAESSCVRHAR